jgi:phosphoglucomutase
MSNNLAGELVPKDRLADISELISLYYEKKPSIENSVQRVSFGTSGHRGSSLKVSFNENHVLAITQAVCEYRYANGIEGILFIGKDSHALSTPAQMSALRVCVANGVKVAIAENDGYTPTPLISFAIIEANKNVTNVTDLCDGIVITPSHNPPEDGGFKYNPTNGGPADTDVTSVIEERANEILANGLKDVKLVDFEVVMDSKFVREYDYNTPYVKALSLIVDIDAIKNANLNIGADPLGGASVAVYEKINEIYDLKIKIVNPYIDPTFSFMTLDHDEKIRMDCSSPHAMASLIKLKDDFDIAFGNDADADRHGIVTKSAGLMNPNHYLSVAIWYLYQSRKEWSKELVIGKTLVSSSMIDRVANEIDKKVYEVPVGFKWFSDGLFKGKIGFGGEESAGASFLKKDGTVWTTDKDGIILNLLAAEILATTKKDPAMIYKELEDKFGKSYYKRVDAPATPEEKSKIKKLSPADIDSETLGDEEILGIFTNAPGNEASIGGVKITAKNGWIAVRPSGTEDIYKIYAESFISEEHLELLIEDGKNIIDSVI